MSITEIIEGEKDLSKEDVDILINRNAIHFSGFHSDLHRTLPLLLKYTLDLAKAGKRSVRLSEFYPQQLPTLDRRTVRNYEVCYEADENGISIVAYDPTSDTVDSRDSYVEQISAQEFLKWAMGDMARMVDVYKHIQSSLREPERTNGEAHRRHLENYF